MVTLGGWKEGGVDFVGFGTLFGSVSFGMGDVCSIFICFISVTSSYLLRAQFISYVSTCKFESMLSSNMFCIPNTVYLNCQVGQ